MLLTQTSEGEWRVPPLLVLARKLYTFQLVINNKSKDVSRL